MGPKHIEKKQDRKITRFLSLLSSSLCRLASDSSTDVCWSTGKVGRPTTWVSWARGHEAAVDEVNAARGRWHDAGEAGIGAGYAGTAETTDPSAGNLG